ncbi:MAG TPA: glycosyltransferase family 2 protein [Candidatus Binatia bacterium]|nr:glycosyltransferase family 2 protein [Candidatus Binatia bacterium]
MNLPSLSVITPSYNSAEFIEDALLSVSRQEGVQVEHIVIDGGSSDETVQRVASHAGVQWISEPDRGQSDAINKGFLRAGGDLVGWLNADDYYLPGGLAAIAQAAREHPQADIIHGDCVFVDSTGRIVRSKVEHDFDRSVLLYFGCYIPSTSTFFRRRIIESGLLLDCDYRVCMDFEYFARLAHAGFAFHYVPRFIAAFRWHGHNTSIRQMARRAEERRQVQRRFGKSGCSDSTLHLLAQVHRAKRLLRKALNGNLAREIRVRRMLGCDTRWLDGEAGGETCKVLACL